MKNDAKYAAISKVAPLISERAELKAEIERIYATVDDQVEPIKKRLARIEAKIDGVFRRAVASGKRKPRQ